MARLTHPTILIRGAGEMASGIAWRLHMARFVQIVMLETPSPLAVRRPVCFSEAVYAGTQEVEGLVAVRAGRSTAVDSAWRRRHIPVLIDPEGRFVQELRPHVLIDAILAKRNLGTFKNQAPLTIALGPGFEAGRDVHMVIESQRGHDLGRILTSGRAAPDTGIPGNIGGFTKERVLRAPCDGLFLSHYQPGMTVRCDQVVGHVNNVTIRATMDGLLRGLLRSPTRVAAGLKIGDIDSRNEPAACRRISDKARALGGSALEAILRVYHA